MANPPTPIQRKINLMLSARENPEYRVYVGDSDGPTAVAARELAERGYLSDFVGDFSGGSYGVTEKGRAWVVNYLKGGR
jgi:hypothetical protein